MRKLLNILAIFACLLAIGITLETAMANSSSQNPAPYSDGNCGYGSVYIPGTGPSGYVGCYSPTGRLHRQVGLCTPQYGTGCYEDECKSPCFTVMP